MKTTVRKRALLLALAIAAPASAQHYQGDFPPEEFRARWEKVYDRIGAEAVAVVQGAPLANGFQLPRQSNSFYYLCGVETPGDLARLAKVGARCFLVGTSLMMQKDVAAATRALLAPVA